MIKTPLMSMMAAPQPGSDGRPLSFRGRITAVKKDPTGKQYSFLFTVAPTLGGVNSGDPDNEIDDVVMLQAGFGNLGRTTVPPSGIVYLPEIGSVVKVDWDGSRWVIVGFYSGPVQTRLESGLDKERQLMSYNPGMETAESRVTGLPGWDLPHWSFGLSPGECIMGREQARVKVTAKGVVLGADLDALRIYTVDGRIVERFGEKQIRGVGYWEVQRFRRGANPEALRNYTQNPTQAEVPPDMACYRCRIQEVAPLPSALRPYIVDQEGYISRTLLNDGRSATTNEVPGNTAVEELTSGDYAVKHHAVAHPLVDNQLKPGNELEDQAYLTTDFQEDADGSFRLRSGNRLKTPGAQTQEASRQMDLSIEYDAAKEEFLLRMGTQGSEATVVHIKGSDPDQAKVSVITSILEATVNEAKVTAKEVEIESPVIKLVGNVDVDGEVTVSKNVVASGEVTARGVKLSKHRHGGVDTGSGTTQIPR